MEGSAMIVIHVFDRIYIFSNERVGQLHSLE